jgi:hypothetical protein
MYGAAARTGATAVTIDHCAGALWNPHATKSIQVWMLTLSRTAAANQWYVQRITAKGTPGSTVTPVIDNDFDRLLAPISGAVIDLAPYSVQPTKAPPDYFRPMSGQNNPGVSQELWFEGGLRLPAGTGLGLFAGIGGTANVFDLSFMWDEGED